MRFQKYPDTCGRGLSFILEWKFHRSKPQYRMSQKMFTRLEGYGIKNMWPIFENKISIFQSKANLDEKMLLGKITHHLDLEIRKIW